MLADFGLKVVREIPLSTIAGLVNGSYSLHGGVVRDATGRIVSHLLTSGSSELMGALIPGANVLSALAGSGQIYSLARDVEQVRQLVSSVLAVSAAGTALSGLGLIASASGTAFLSRKLNGVLHRLEHIQRLLKDQHLSVLKGAIDNLKHAENAADRETRRAMLVSAKTDFSKSAHFYGSQFADPKTIDEVLVLEDSFALAAMGSAMSLSELEMHGAAAADFEGHLDRWRPLARKHVKNFLLGENPHRLLGAAFVDQVPANELAETLDFVHSERKSWLWIDELRRQKAASRIIGLPSSPWSVSEIAFKQSVQVARTLRAKDQVLDAFCEHLRFLDGKKLSVEKFARLADDERKAQDGDSVCILDADRT